MIPEESYDKKLLGLPSPPLQPPQRHETQSPPIYDSVALLGGSQEILICHQGEVYRLRLTRNDKLILTK